MIICVLGRQPELGLAELEALYGAEQVTPAGDHCALVNADVDFSRLGGSVKAAQLLDTVSDTNLRSALKRVGRLLPAIIGKTPAEGKIKLGLSTYGFDISAYQLSGEALRLKKSVRNTGRSLRVVPNEASALSSAQTYHNHLAEELGIEIIIVKTADTTVIGQVTDVQNIDNYRIRDRERPKRDPFVGMLPPKLAQIIVNLATGSANTASVLDPFCGTGVVLQEALLMGYEAYGTDLSPKMVDYTTINLKWLKDNQRWSMDKSPTATAVADATKFTWNISAMKQPLCIASETYLGQPLGGQNPSAEKLAEIVHDSNRIVRDFLRNLAPQITSGTRLCLAVPAWFVGNTTTRLPLVDELTSLGYEPHTFTNIQAPLIYHRETQVTGRELLILVKQ